MDVLVTLDICGGLLNIFIITVTFYFATFMYDCFLSVFL